MRSTQPDAIFLQAGCRALVAGLKFRLTEYRLWIAKKQPQALERRLGSR